MHELFIEAPSDEAMRIFGQTSDGTCLSLTDAITLWTPRYAVKFGPRIGLIGTEHVKKDTQYTSATIDFPGLTEFFN
jgi:hypothetical protein